MVPAKSMYRVIVRLIDDDYRVFIIQDRGAGRRYTMTVGGDQRHYSHPTRYYELLCIKKYWLTTHSNQVLWSRSQIIGMSEVHVLSQQFATYEELVQFLECQLRGTDQLVPPPVELRPAIDCR